MSGVVSIQGNLGAGKSTLLSLLNISTIKEPVDEWEHLGGGNILKNYYQDPKRWAFTFQLNALHSRNLLWHRTIKDHPDSVHFSQRSPMADRHIFGQIMHHQGNMDAAEYMIYSTLCDKLIQESPLKAIIYLRCPPQVCLQRIHQRNREGEQRIPLQYLKKVHERHEEWLKGITNIPILTVDTGEFDIYCQKDQIVVTQMIMDFMNGLDVKFDRKLTSTSSEQEEKEPIQQVSA